MFAPASHSFVVCAYKESPYLQECVKSLLAQTLCTNIVMATSTPNEHIRSIAEKAGIKLYENDAKPGIGSDWNYAVSCAGTPLVTLAHQDDTYMPTYAETMLEQVNGATRPLIFFSNYGELRDGHVVDNNKLLRVKRKLLKPLVKAGGITDRRRIKRAVLKLGNSICCPSVTLNMNQLPRPPFNEQMGSNLDWDAWERFSRLNGEFVYCPEILMHHRIHLASTTSELIGNNTRTAEDLEMLERFWPTPVARTINLAYSLGQKSNAS